MENHTCLYRKAFIMLLVCLVCTFTVSAQQVARGLTASNGVFIGFYDYKPLDYNANPSTKYPLIIFLHGLGERGNGTSHLPNVLNVALPRYINQGHPMRFFWNGKWETFLVLSPQLSTNYGWWPNFYVEEMLKYARNNKRVDTNRIFLTGLSLGGGGTWQYAGGSLANAKKFAAIAPVCSICTGVNMCNVANANLPVWAFHASDDGVVNVNCTNNAVNKINQCNPAVKPIRTIWPDGNHWIWDRAYDTVYNWQNPNLFEWFLGQNKSLLVNRLPIAKAGDDQVMSNNPDTTMLHAAGSSDPDGSIVRYIWKKISGPGAVSITSPANSTTRVTGLSQPGSYVFELTVVDNRASRNKDTVSVQVTSGPPLPPANQLPVANAGDDTVLLLPDHYTTLNGSGSMDPDGTIKSYLWTKVKGPATYTLANNNSANVMVSNLIAGVYEFRLQVTDNMGDADDDFVSITVKSVNEPPLAKAGPDTSISLPATEVTLNGSGSNDPDGTIVKYQWTKILGPDQYNIDSVNAVSTKVTSLKAGTYSFVLRVWDNEWIPADDTVYITVLPPSPVPNKPPVADAGSDFIITLPANSVNLNGSASFDEDSITAYSWKKQTGPDSFSLQTPTEIVTKAYNLGSGVYTFQLKVTDKEGLTGVDTVMVTVHPAQPSPPPANLHPEANAGMDMEITLPLNTVVLNAKNSSDPDGTISSFSWSKISGPVQYFISSPNAAISNVGNLIQGLYAFRLEVIDNDGSPAVDTVLIKVHPVINKRPVAHGGTDTIVIQPASQAILNGSGSVDPDGQITHFSWSQLSGSSSLQWGSPDSAICSLDNLAEGVYVFRLVVTDNKGLTDDDTVQVTVQPAPNAAPVAHAGADTLLFYPANSLQLDGSKSQDPDGMIAVFNWVRFSGPGEVTLSNSSTARPLVAGLQAGVHIFQLNVTDNKGKISTDQVKISVKNVLNRQPVAHAGEDTTIIAPASNALLQATGSMDSDGSITVYAWKQIGGAPDAVIEDPSSSGTLVRQLNEGEYLFELAVTDDRGAKARDTVKIAVVNNFRLAEYLSLYPNPVRHTINIRCISLSMGSTVITIFDLRGKVIKKTIVEKNQSQLIQQIHLPELTEGVYFVEVVVNNQKHMIGKFIKY